ncbi:hypothetical protein [Sulfurovum sp. NBC37-1]|uniref:hypothetical protein n=1 Tax=Sulfurovum sp. (strain NBC37-1) TaxID=387093 RepID=UPI0001587608|nr:hypothetical protein [Sulfurovum sp. NBC37-1]BAF72175.1 conserved hypothetical protein [Sulfurovum sp. NBC37-1]
MKNPTLTKYLMKLLFWALILFFVLFYPMLISFYVFLPLLVGVMGYLFISGVDQGKWGYVLISLIYFINLELNLSLPFFLILISVLIVYMLFYGTLTHLKKCKICVPILTVLLIDVVYLGILLAYDFIFSTHSIVLDNILLYSLIVDLLVVVVI